MVKQTIFTLLVITVCIVSTRSQKLNCKEVASSNLKPGQFWLLCSPANSGAGGGNGPQITDNLVASGSEFQPVYKPKPKPASFGYWGKK